MSITNGNPDNYLGSVSYSETSSYTLCPRKHWYGYTLSLERKRTSDSLAMGGAGHEIFEVYYRVILSGGESKKAQRAMMPQALIAAQARYDEIVAAGYHDSENKATLHSMLFEFYFPNEPLVSEGWQILAVEETFTLDTETEAGVIRTPTKIDVVAFDPLGKMVVIDHKFIYEFYTFDSASLQPQVPLYIGVLRGLGYSPDYGLYNMIRNRKIKAPTLDQRCRTLEIKPSGNRVVRTFREQLDTAEEIQQRKLLPLDVLDLKSHRVANGMVCKSCSFKDLCSLELAGGNAEAFKRNEFKIRERQVFTASAEADEDDD